MSFRLLSRSVKLNQVRFASSESPISKITNQASELTKKAASTAQNAVEQVATSANATISKTSPLLSGLVNKTVYNAKVGAEVAKEVFRREGMAFPKKENLGAAKEELLSFVKPEYIKKFDKTQLYTLAYCGAQVYGFFLVGEIIGRFNLVGYNV